MTEGLVGGETCATDASIIQADANKQYSAPKAEWVTAKIDPAVVPRAVREYLETLDDTAFGAASEVTPKFTSFSDPASQWTGALKGPAFFAYSTNYLIDTEHAIIVDVEATRAIRPAEVGATQTMLTRTRDRFDLFPDRLAADTAYGSGNMLGWLVEQDIEPHIPVIHRPAGHCTAMSREGTNQIAKTGRSPTSTSATIQRPMNTPALVANPSRSTGAKCVPRAPA